jgi:hypothetical protein
VALLWHLRRVCEALSGRSMGREKKSGGAGGGALRSVTVAYCSK